MKKIIISFLTVTSFSFSALSCSAKTSWNTYNQDVYQKRVVVQKQKDGEEIVIHGEKSPTFVINNKSESKSSASASSGGVMSKVVPLAIKIFALLFAGNYLKNKLSSLGSNLSNAMSSLKETISNLNFSNIFSQTAPSADNPEDVGNNESFFSRLKHLTGFVREKIQNYCPQWREFLSNVLRPSMVYNSN